jgi:DNA polymerase sigma
MDFLRWTTAYRALHTGLLRFAENSASCGDDVQQTLKYINSLSQELFPDSKALLLGSHATGLALFDSDVDVVIVGPDLFNAQGKGRVSIVDMQTSLQKIAHKLESDEGCDHPGHVKVQSMIMHARVPIIKCFNKAGRKCDISYGIRNGLDALGLVAEKVNQYPSLRPILLSFKQLLRSRDLNDLSSGGLSSYGLFHMILAVVTTTGSAIEREKGLGGLLIHILEFYGRNFVPGHMIVKVTGVEPAYTQANRHLVGFTYSNRLRVMDMLDPSIEVVKGCTKHTEILAVFASAAHILGCGE